MCCCSYDTRSRPGGIPATAIELALSVLVGLQLPRSCLPRRAWFRKCQHRVVENDSLPTWFLCLTGGALLTHYNHLHHHMNYRVRSFAMGHEKVLSGWFPHVSWWTCFLTSLVMSPRCSIGVVFRHCCTTNAPTPPYEL